MGNVKGLSLTEPQFNSQLVIEWILSYKSLIFKYIHIITTATIAKVPVFSSKQMPNLALDTNILRIQIR